MHTLSHDSATICGHVPMNPSISVIGFGEVDLDIEKEGMLALIEHLWPHPFQARVLLLQLSPPQCQCGGQPILEGRGSWLLGHAVFASVNL